MNKTNISSTSKVKGNISSQEDIIVEGEVSGKVSTSKKLEIKKLAQVKADLTAENIVIAGVVEGNIKAKGKLDIAKTGEVYGNLEAKITSIASGAVLDGECKIGEGNKSEISALGGKEGFENLNDEEPKIDILEGK